MVVVVVIVAMVFVVVLVVTVMVVVVMVVVLFLFSILETQHKTKRGDFFFEVEIQYFNLYLNISYVVAKCVHI